MTHFNCYLKVHGITKERSLSEGTDLRTAIDEELFPLFARAHYVAGED